MDILLGVVVVREEDCETEGGTGKKMRRWVESVVTLLAERRMCDGLQLD